MRLSRLHNMTTLLQHVHKNMDYLQTAKCNESITKQDVIDQMTSFNVSIVHNIVCTPSVACYCLPVEPSLQNDAFLAEIERVEAATNST
jgi:hypothetical protein